MQKISRKPEKIQTLDRALALAAIVTVGVYEYGMRVLLLCAVSAAVCMVTELSGLYVRRVRFGLRHLEAAVCGVILVMLLPVTVPLPLLIMSGIFAIIIGRQVFGGGEQPVFPSAAVGYCFARLMSPDSVLLYPAKKGAVGLFRPETDTLVQGISARWNHSGTFAGKADDLLLGLPNQPLGTGSLVLLGVIALVLLCRRSASGWVLVPLLISLIGGSAMLGWYRDPLTAAAACCVTDQALFSSVFLLADPFYTLRGLAGIAIGFTEGALIIFLTRFCGVTDAPVMLALLAAPLCMLLRTLAAMAQTDQKKQTDQTNQKANQKGDADRDAGQNEDAGELPAAPEPDPS